MTPAIGRLGADPQLQNAAIGRGEGSGGSLVHSLSVKQDRISPAQVSRGGPTQTLMIDTT